MFESLSDRLQGAFAKLRNRGVVRPEDVEAALREVRVALLEADVNYRVVKEFGERVREKALGGEVLKSLSPAQQVVKIVHDELQELLGGQPAGLTYSPRPPTVVMLVGLQGSGKTTTAVKLAWLARKDGHRPLVVALDLRRPAAVEQLRQLAAREKVAFAGGDTSKAVTKLAKEALDQAQAEGLDFVVLDTAGRLQVDEELMAELGELRKAVPVTQTLLVADAMTGQEAVNVGEAFDRAVGIDGAVLTKLDGDARGGAALSLRVATGKPVRFAGVGEKPQDLEVFHPDRMASRILGMGDVMTLIEKAQENVREEEVAQVERSLRAGRLSFDDMLLQMRQVKSLGMDSMLGMLPGGNRLKGALEGQDAEREMKRMEAMILSMTRREREHPELIDGSRRKRIARGAGVGPADVNRLLRSREQMQQLMRQLTGGGRKRGRGALDISRLLGGNVNW